MRGWYTNSNSPPILVLFDNVINPHRKKEQNPMIQHIPNLCTLSVIFEISVMNDNECQSQHDIESNRIVNEWDNSKIVNHKDMVSCFTSLCQVLTYFK